MTNRTPILDELQPLSPVVAQISPLAPYRVPAGYFEGLAGEILQRIQSESSIIFLQVTSNPYTVPQGYFEGLANTILNRIKAEEAATAHEELSALSPLLSGIGKKTPFSTPAGYFDELTDNAVSGAKAIEFVNDELENLSPLMSSLKGKQVYTVPAGYFDHLAAALVSKTVTRQPAKVVSMTFTRKVMRYAVAAVVAGLIVTAGWFYLSNGNKKDIQGNNNPQVAQNTPTVSDVTKDIQGATDEELQGYLEDDQNAALAVTNVLTAASTETSSIDMKDMLADVSDAELQKYLDQFSNTKDILTN